MPYMSLIERVQCGGRGGGGVKDVTIGSCRSPAELSITEC